MDQNNKVDAYGIEEMGWDKVPFDIVDKTVIELMSLKGKKAIVTGASGVGLGFAVANRLAGLGADVVMVGRSNKIYDNAKYVAEKWGVNTYPLQCDLTDYDAVGEMFKKANELMGRIDILINNAMSTHNGPFHIFDEKMIRESIDGSFTSQVFCCRHVCDYMMKQKSGRIINIGSESAYRAKNPDIGLYAATKGGIISLTRTLAGELAPYGIIVNSVVPGLMFHSDLRKVFENPTPENYEVRKLMVLGNQDCLAGRAGMPEEVANTVAFLCTDAASYIYGQNICNGAMVV